MINNLSYPTEKETRKIVFVDGYCNLCHQLVQILLLLDTQNTLFFSSLESSFSTTFFSEKHSTILSINSVVFYDGNELYFKSDAILKVAHTLGFPFSLCQIFFLIPKGFRDFIYDLVAKFRYKIFGKNSVCHITAKEENVKFLKTPNQK
jgi:predicted DCC family thiol-disulfide oxidoreductase YuxK